MNNPPTSNSSSDTVSSSDSAPNIASSSDSAPTTQVCIQSNFVPVPRRKLPTRRRYKPKRD